MEVGPGLKQSRAEDSLHNANTDAKFAGNLVMPMARMDESGRRIHGPTARVTHTPQHAGDIYSENRNGATLQTLPFGPRLPPSIPLVERGC
jgi:hypothetical protein